MIYKEFDGEKMSKKILIDAVYPGETRVVILDKNRIQDFDYENSHKKQLKGNIYLAKITRIEPSLQAAFIEYAGEKHGFLPFNEVHPCYFNVDTNEASEATGKAIEKKINSITLPEFSEVEEIIDNDNNSENNLPVENTGSDAEETIKDLSETKEESDLSEEEELRGVNHNSLHHKYKIQDVLKKGQTILIQIQKEERGNKGAACTTYISLAGRYCVLMPNSDKQGGISRRIQNPNDRRRLKKVLNTIDLPEGVSIILRTAGADRNINDIRRDYYYLARLWNALRDYIISAKANCFIHAESDLLKRTIRDLYSSEITEIKIQGTESYKAAKEFMKKILPAHAQKIKEYKETTPIFTKYHIEDQISALYSPIANLPSGGYIVINPTEALVAIDVNSGRATNEKNIEETAVKTNIEAALESARQIKLRDISGLVVIDFIDMVEGNNRRLVEKTLRDALQSDRAKVQLGNISPFGLLELSRQRLQSSFLENNATVCPACKGKGHIKSFEVNSLIILRTIEVEIHKGDCQEVNVYAHSDLVVHLLNHNRKQLNELETKYNCKIIIHKENNVYYDGFGIEKTLKDPKDVRDGAQPKFSEEEYFDSYGQDLPENELLLKNESLLGLGDDIAPYQVNDQDRMVKANKGFNNSRRNFSRRRKISGTNRNPMQEAPKQQPALIFQPEGENKTRTPGRRHRRRGNRINGRPEVNGNKATEKKSVLKSWWEKLID